MINTWLAAVDELEAILEGKAVIPLGGDQSETGLSVKKLLDEAPPAVDLLRTIGKQDDRFNDKGRPADFTAMGAAFQMFSQPLMMGYAAWFN